MKEEIEEQLAALNLDPDATDDDRAKLEERLAAVPPDLPQWEQELHTEVQKLQGALQTYQRVLDAIRGVLVDL